MFLSTAWWLRHEDLNISGAVAAGVRRILSQKGECLWAEDNKIKWLSSRIRLSSSTTTAGSRGKRGEGRRGREDGKGQSFYEPKLK